MGLLLLCPFILQMILIFVDEYVFHLKRGLPRWERIGHPLDTFSILICMAIVLAIHFSAFWIKIYIGCSLFSCFLVTKDEFVHKKHCPSAEQWVHALLFINHPLLLTSLGLSWYLFSADPLPGFLKFWDSRLVELRYFLIIQALAAVGFFLYQIIFWK